jgi:hypothetical protein
MMNEKQRSSIHHSSLSFRFLSLVDKARHAQITSIGMMNDE